jgi:hypothetical protein
MSQITVFGITTDMIEDKDNNLIRVNLTDNGQDSEGIWAYVNDATKMLSDAESRSKDYDCLAVTANSTLNGVPWGCYIPIKLNGSKRATSDMVFIRANSDRPLPCINIWGNAVQNVINAFNTDANLADFDADSLKFYSRFLGDDHKLIKKLSDLMDERNK